MPPAKKNPENPNITLFSLLSGINLHMEVFSAGLPNIWDLPKVDIIFTDVNYSHEKVISTSSKFSLGFNTNF